MAKSCCGGSEPRTPRQIPVTLDRFGEVAVTGDYPKVRIRYEGPVASHMVTGLATKQKYGRKRRGDIFWVMREDAQDNPEWFVVVGDADGANLAADLPKTALEIKRPEIPPPPPPEELPMVLRPVAEGDTGRMNRADLMRDFEKEITNPQSVVEMRERALQKQRELEEYILKDHPELNRVDLATGTVKPEALDFAEEISEPGFPFANTLHSMSSVQDCPKCGKPAEEIIGRRKYCYECSPAR